MSPAPGQAAAPMPSPHSPLTARPGSAVLGAHLTLITIMCEKQWSQLGCGYTTALIQQKIKFPRKGRACARPPFKAWQSRSGTGAAEGKPPCGRGPFCARSCSVGVQAHC